MAETDYGFEESVGGIVYAQGIFEESASAKHRIGTRRQLTDGRVFYYAKAGGALAAGKLAMAKAIVDNHTNKAVTAASAIGSKSITLTLGATAATKNQYAEGYLFVNDATGEGYTYKLRTHPAASASGSLTLTLYDPVQVALVASTSEVTLLASPFSSVTHSATEESVPAGIPPIAVTSGYYLWLQTWGYANCLRGDTADHGSILRPDSTAGELSGETATNNVQITMPLCAISACIGVDTEYRPVLLQIMP